MNGNEARLILFAAWYSVISFAYTSHSTANWFTGHDARGLLFTLGIGIVFLLIGLAMSFRRRLLGNDN